MVKRVSDELVGESYKEVCIAQKRKIDDLRARLARAEGREWTIETAVRRYRNNHIDATEMTNLIRAALTDKGQDDE